MDIKALNHPSTGMRAQVKPSQSGAGLPAKWKATSSTQAQESVLARMERGTWFWSVAMALDER